MRPASTTCGLNGKRLSPTGQAGGQLVVARAAAGQVGRAIVVGRPRVRQVVFQPPGIGQWPSWRSAITGCYVLSRDSRSQSKSAISVLASRMVPSIAQRTASDQA